jgi:hypothetical protein
MHINLLQEPNRRTLAITHKPKRSGVKRITVPNPDEIIDISLLKTLEQMLNDPVILEQVLQVYYFLLCEIYTQTEKKAETEIGCLCRSYTHTAERTAYCQTTVMVLSSKSIRYSQLTRVLFRYFCIMMKLKLLTHLEARQENIS